MKAVAGLSVRPLNPGPSAHLDLIRAVAAWAVMCGHLRALFFVDFAQLQSPSFLLKTAYFVTGFGTEAVLVFFVLSGFLISSAIFGRLAKGSWSWRDYAIDRASRLYVVLIPGLLFGFLWDKLGSTIFASSGMYSHPLQSFASAVVQNRMGGGTFVGNLLFLQTIVCQPFGSNGPLWSLANEFWYYVLFPVLLAAGIACIARSVLRALALTILAVAVAGFVGWHILVGFPIWLAGTALVVAYRNRPLTSKAWLTVYVLVSVSALSLCLVAARTGKLAVLGSNLAVGIAFALFLFGVLHLNFGAGGSVYLRMTHVLAGFSYSLYVLHFPFLLFLRAWFVPPQRWPPDSVHLLGGLLVGAVTLGFAWLVSTFTESKTRVIRQWMRGAGSAPVHPAT